MGRALGILREKNDPLLVGENVRPEPQLWVGCRVEVEYNVAVVLLRRLIVSVYEVVKLFGEKLRAQRADGEESVGSTGQDDILTVTSCDAEVLVVEVLAQKATEDLLVVVLLCVEVREIVVAC